MTAGVDGKGFRRGEKDKAMFLSKYSSHNRGFVFGLATFIRRDILGDIWLAIAKPQYGALYKKNHPIIIKITEWLLS